MGGGGDDKSSGRLDPTLQQLAVTQLVPLIAPVWKSHIFICFGSSVSLLREISSKSVAELDNKQMFHLSFWAFFQTRITKKVFCFYYISIFA